MQQLVILALVTLTTLSALGSCGNRTEEEPISPSSAILISSGSVQDVRPEATARYYLYGSSTSYEDLLSETIESLQDWSNQRNNVEVLSLPAGEFRTGSEFSAWAKVVFANGSHCWTYKSANDPDIQSSTWPDIVNSDTSVANAPLRYESMLLVVSGECV